MCHTHTLSVRLFTGEPHTARRTRPAASHTRHPGRARHPPGGPDTPGRACHPPNGPVTPAQNLQRPLGLCGTACAGRGQAAMALAAPGGREAPAPDLLQCPVPASPDRASGPTPELQAEYCGVADGADGFKEHYDQSVPHLPSLSPPRGASLNHRTPLPRPTASALGPAHRRCHPFCEDPQRACGCISV